MSPGARQLYPDPSLTLINHYNTVLGKSAKASSSDWKVFVQSSIAALLPLDIVIIATVGLLNDVGLVSIPIKDGHVLTHKLIIV